MSRGFFLVAVSVITAACGADAPTDSSNEDVPSQTRLVRIDGSVAMSADDRTVHMTFIGGAPYSPDDRCSTLYAGWARPAGDMLQIAVMEVIGARPLPGFECPAMGYLRFVHVNLDEPFHGNTARELNTRRDLHVERPEGLMEIAGLPDGWQLRSMGKIEEHAGALWQRTYSPLPDPTPDEPRLDVYQAFGGPVGITGGTEQQRVVVGDAEAVLSTDAVTGNLLLVWRVGPSGLALATNERAFSIEELMVLAESVSAGP